MHHLEQPYGGRPRRSNEEEYDGDGDGAVLCRPIANMLMNVVTCSDGLCICDTFMK